MYLVSFQRAISHEGQVDVRGITEVADMENQSEQRNDELQEAFHARTAESHGDEGNLNSENFIGTQPSPTGAVGPPGRRLMTLRCGVDKKAARGGRVQWKFSRASTN